MSSLLNNQLPAPTLIETLDFESVLAELLADFQQRYPAFSAPLESDPIYKMFETAAYRELILRNRINQAAKGVMVFYAQKSDLDQLGANLKAPRLAGESDDDYRPRIPLAMEGLSTAGPRGSYEYHASSAHADVKDINVESPSPNVIVVTVLSKLGSGVPTQQLLDTVLAAINEDDVRPLTDNVSSQAASINSYTVTAQLTRSAGPASAAAVATATENLTTYVDAQHRLGGVVTLSGIYSALHIAGIERVQLDEPTVDLITASATAPHCSGINISEVTA